MTRAQHPRRDELFRGDPLEETLSGWVHSARNSARWLSHSQAMAISDADWETGIVDKYGVAPLILDETAAYVEVDDSGHNAPIYVVPFAGDPSLFAQDPRDGRSRNAAGYASGPLGRVADGLLRVELGSSGAGLPMAQVIDIRMKTIRQHVAAVNDQLEGFEQVLRDVAAEGLCERRSQAERHQAFIASSPVPVRPRDDAPATFQAPPVARLPRPAVPVALPSGSAPIPPRLADDLFDHILIVMRAAGRAMSRAPETYAGWGEEDRRQALLLMLNTHYVGQAYAEAFNGQGKTDLLIRVEDRNLFIGECLIWSGAKSLIDKLEQLFGYSTWDDVRLALVAFVPNRDLTAVIAAGGEALEGHPSFRDRVAPPEEAELRVRLAWPGDDARVVMLHVLFVHTPVSPRAEKIDRTVG
jgi:hypothetical protein